VFFIDAFAFDYLEEIGFLSDISLEVSPLDTLLGYSSSIMPSIWSGLYPEETGVWTEFYFCKRKPYTAMKLIGKIPDIYLKNAVKYCFLKLWKNRLNYRQTLLGIPESIEHLFCRNDITYWNFPPIELNCETFDKIMRKKKISYNFNFYNYEIPKNLVSFSPKSFFSSQVIIRYIATLDACGHFYGPNPKMFKEKIRDIERLILESYKRLSAEYDVDLVIFSDHGMTSVKTKYDLLKRLETIDTLKIVKDYLVFIDSTIARFWFFNTRAKERITQNLENINCGHILESDEIAEYGLRFKDNRYGDLIFVAEPGVEFFPSFMRPLRFPFIGSDPKGLHGYTPEHPSTRGVFMYSGNKHLRLKRTMKITEILQKLKIILD